MLARAQKFYFDHKLN